MLKSFILKRLIKIVRNAPLLWNQVPKGKYSRKWINQKVFTQWLEVFLLYFWWKPELIAALIHDFVQIIDSQWPKYSTALENKWMNCIPTVQHCINGMDFKWTACMKIKKNRFFCVDFFNQNSLLWKVFPMIIVQCIHRSI